MRSHLSAPINKATRAAMRAAMRRALIELRNLIREKISEPVVSGVRSKPFEPPFKDRGDLWKSYRWRIKSDGTAREVAEIYTKSAIARYLEDGTYRMEQRPHFRDTVKEYGLRGKIKRYFKEEMEKRAQADISEDSSDD